MSRGVFWGMWRHVAMHIAFWRNLLSPSSAQKTHYVQQSVGHFKLSCFICHFLSLLFRYMFSVKLDLCLTVHHQCR
jgi:hypothetical protein